MRGVSGGIMRLLRMRWFGIYAGFLLLGWLLGLIVFGMDAAGFGTFAGQSLFALIFVSASELDKRVKRWLLGSWV